MQPFTTRQQRVVDDCAARGLVSGAAVRFWDLYDFETEDPLVGTIMGHSFFEGRHSLVVTVGAERHEVNLAEVIEVVEPADLSTPAAVLAFLSA